MRVKGIHFITPAECIIRIQGFIARMKRLEDDNYTLPRLKTQDLNKLKYDILNMNRLASIGIYNKNAERAKSIIVEAGSLMPKARKIYGEYENTLWKKKQKQS
uniref:hypothetical protein n=1 Tax=uncultured Draconibacterium sp. TaxID=1573823 RepID=UPI003217011D